MEAIVAAVLLVSVPHANHVIGRRIRFLRGLPHLSQRMRRVLTKDGKKSDVLTDGDQPVPDFYAISRENPVPNLPDGERDGRAATSDAANTTTPPIVTGLDFSKSSGFSLPTTGSAPSSTTVPDEIAVLEQRRRELLLLQLATLQGAQGNQQQSQMAAFSMPSAPQLDMSGNNQLLGMLGQYGFTMQMNQAPVAAAPFAPNATMQQLLAFQQQQQFASSQAQGGLLNGVNLNDLLNPKPAAPAPAPGALNLSQLNGINLQALLGNSGNAAALQQLLGNNGNPATSGDFGSKQGQASSAPLQDDVQKLLQAVSGTNGMTNDNTLEGLKRQLSGGQSSASSPQQGSNDWQGQLGRGQPMSQQQQQAPVGMTPLMAQLHRQMKDTGGSTSEQPAQQQDHITALASSLRNHQQSNGQQPSGASQMPDMQRLLSGGGANANELLAMLLGNSGR